MTTRYLERLACVGLSAAMIVGLAGCGGPDEAAGEPKTGAGTTADSLIKESTSNVERASRPVSEILVKEPLGQEPPADGLIVYLQPDLATAEGPGIGIKRATQALGWDYKSIQVDIAEPSTLVAGMKDALQYDPTAVVLVTTPIQVWQGQIPAYEKAGVKIVPIFQQTEQTDTVIANVVGPEDVARAGTAVADYLISDSEGAGRGLVVYAPDIASEAEFAKSVHERLDDCDGCGSIDLELTAAQLGDGSGTSAVISALQKDPEIDYILNGYGPQLPGLTGALKSAGMAGKVKITGYAGGPTDFEAISKGDMDAYTATPYIYSGYAAVDAVLRSLQDMPVDPDAGGVPLRLVTKDQNFDVAAMSEYEEPEDALDQFKELWGIK